MCVGLEDNVWTWVPSFLHADPGRERGPSGLRLYLLSILAAPNSRFSVFCLFLRVVLYSF